MLVCYSVAIILSKAHTDRWQICTLCLPRKAFVIFVLMEASGNT